jgi:CarD family transcriptional regulator
MFKLKDQVIYPGYGAAVIEEEVEKVVGGSVVKFFKLVLNFKDVTILVPGYNLNAMGIRKPNACSAIDLIIKELSRRPKKSFEEIDFTPSGWNRRCKEYQIRIQSGDMLEVAKIYRDLMFIGIGKDLSFGEKYLLQSTEELLAQEIMVSRRVEKGSALQEIRSPFKNIFSSDKEPAARHSVLSH